jgi:endo-1,4-beta-mannosidase
MRLDRLWGYLVKEDIAPVWVSEFGWPHTFSDNDKTARWLPNFVDYLQNGPAGGLGWAYWQLSGEETGGTGKTPGKTENFGLLNHCWTAPASTSHFEKLQQIMTSPGSLASQRASNWDFAPQSTQSSAAEDGEPDLHE